MPRTTSMGVVAMPVHAWPSAPPGGSIGTIAPYDFALDREIWRWVPDEVSLLVTRTHRLRLTATVQLAEELSTDDTVRTATDEVLAAEPDVLLYLCASGSFVRGTAGERRLREVMLGAGAPRAVTTSGAMLDALAHLGVTTVAVATPYVPAVTRQLERFLGEAGVRVASSRGLGLVRHIWRVPPAAVRDLVLTADHAAAEAVFISCTNLPTYDLISPLEAATGKPVLSANQVSLWGALRAAGLPLPRNGQRLFATAAPVSA